MVASSRANHNPTISFGQCKETSCPDEANFAADVGLLEDVHRLHEQRILNADILNQLLYGGRFRELTENGSRHEARADLFIELLCFAQISVGQEGILFKEETNLISRAQK